MADDLSEKYGGDLQRELIEGKREPQGGIADPRHDALISNPDLREAFNDAIDEGKSYDEAMEWAHEQLPDGSDEADPPAEGPDRNEAKDRTQDNEETSGSENKGQRSFDEWDG